MDFKVDESALKWLDSLHKESPDKNKILLINLIKSGCSGWAYHYSWLSSDNEYKGKLLYLTLDNKNCGFKVAFPEMYQEYVKGAVLTFVTEGFNSRLIVDNPNVSTLCGCGESVNFEK